MYQRFCVILIVCVCSACSIFQEKTVLSPEPELIGPFSDEIPIRESNPYAVPPLIAAAEANDFRLISNLLLDGANVNIKDRQGKSALHYAFNKGNFEAFKVLLESGAKIDFPLSYTIASSSFQKMKLYKLAKEYLLVKKIRHSKTTDPQTFDSYFSEFSNGYYVGEIEKQFEKIIRKAYHKALSSGSQPVLQKFVEKYSDLGNHCYLVMVSDLNIRADHSQDSKKMGQYLKGERVFARQAKEGWIQTDRGWINKNYTKQIKKRIPVLQPFLRSAEQKLESVSGAVKIKHSSIKTEQRSLKTETRKKSTTETQETTKIEKELEAILAAPSLSKIEAFINKYKDDTAYSSVVDKAKKEYRRILLRDL